MMPAFSEAIFSMLSPRNSWWSWEIEVITEIFGIMTLLLSSLPPSPVSSRVKSDFVFEKEDLVVFLTKREHLEKVESLFRISSLI